MEAGCVVAAVIENATSGPRGEPGSGDVLEGDVLSSSDLDKDDVSPQQHNSENNPSEKRQQEETHTAMARSDDIISEHPAEPLLRSCVSTASMKVKNMKKLTFPRGHFPRLEECAHFHYETVDFGNVQLAFADGQSEGPKAALDSKELLFLIQITCQGRNWLVKRSYEDFRVLDKHLHLCIYDRRYSQLAELPRYEAFKDAVESVTKMLATYLSRFSVIADNKINCGPVLTWMEIDNKGNHLLVTEEASINVPAIAAAHVTKRYTAQATDELTFEVGDIVSVIDMPPKEDTGWWRGKHGFQVGFFPCDCVELINDKIPPSVQSSVPKPVCKKHGKLVTFLRSFMKSRPPPQKLRQRGILRERVFGCDLGEHLHNSGHEVPQVVKSCADFIEKLGVVDGIYRLSGISSNIQKLRHEFDSEQIPDLSRDVFRQDIHSVGSLCKLYFRELPNPLLTYQLYDRFSEAVSAATDEERLVKIHNVIQQLPPPHYRTLEFLMRHLSRLATFSSVTSMHTKNLAIVWAPNLLRSRQIESACFSGTAAFMEVRIQSVVVEFILNNTEALFSTKLNAIIRENTGNNTLSRPKSLLICSPSTKLLSLEEAQARTQAQLSSPATTPSFTHSDYIEVGEGPEALLGKFHTVIELPMESINKRPPAKAKKSPVGNWLSFFHLGKSHSLSKRKLKRHPSEPNEIKSIALPGGRGDSGTLRSTKSEESLTSLHNMEGEPPSYRPLRPRSVSEALSANDDLHRSAKSKNDQSKLHPPNKSLHHGADTGPTAAATSPPHQEDELDLCPPAAGISTLDFDPMSFQCSPLAATPGLKRGASKLRRSAGCSSESEPISSLNNNNISGFQSPESSPVLGKVGKKVPTKQQQQQQQLSPKLRKKSFKTQADVQAASTFSPPLPSSCPPATKGDAPLAEVKGTRVSYQHCSPISTASQASALTDLSQSAQNLPDPGTDRLMSSVSVLLPHPPSMSAARKLALALAESAHKATIGSQRRNHNLPPHAAVRMHEACHVQERPPRPSVLDIKVYPEEFGSPRVSPSIPQWQTSAHGPAESLFCPHPVHIPAAHFCTEQAADGRQSASNYTPNVSPLGSGSLDEGGEEKRLGGVDRGDLCYQSVGVSTPTQPACLAHSPTTSPVYVNTDSSNVFNFRAVLAETSMPSSVDEVVLPRPLPLSSNHRYSPDEDRPLGLVEDFYGNHHHHHPPPQHWPVHGGRTPTPHCPRFDALPHHLSGPKGLFRHNSESHYNSLGLRQPMSPQYVRYHRDERLVGGGHRQREQWQGSGGRVGHPAIRRARSFHAPQISHYELAATEALAPDTVFYVEQKPSNKAPYQRLVQSGVHPVRLQFENAGATDPRYGAFADVNPMDGARYYAEPCWQKATQHSPAFTLHNREAREQSDYYNYSPQRVAPVSRDANVYEARDAFEGVAYQPIRQESKSRSKSTYPATSPYDESPVSPTDAGSRDIIHTRSKSDPGNACLLSTDITVARSPTSPTPQQADTRQLQAEPGPPRRVHVKESSARQPPLRKIPSLPERDVSNLKSAEHKDRSHTRSREQAGLTATNAVNNSYSGFAKPSILRRPGRSQSTRENRHYYHYHAKSPQDPEHLGSFSSQLNRRTQSTKVRPTQYDHAKEYYAAAPRPKPTRSAKATGGFLPGQGCVSPHGHRLLSKVLGQEGFVRSEAGLYEGF